MLLVILLGIIILGFFLSVTILRKKSTSVLEESDLLNKSPEQLQNIIRLLKIENKEAKECIEKLQKNINHSRAEVTALEWKLRDAESKTAKLQDIQSKIAALQADKIILNKQLREAEQARKALIEELSGALGSIEVAFIETATWSALILEIKQVLDKTREAEAKIQQVTEENNCLNRKYRDVSQKNERLNKELNNIKNELENIQGHPLNKGKESVSSSISGDSLSSYLSNATSSQANGLENTNRELQQQVFILQAFVAQLQDSFDKSVEAQKLLEYLNDELENLIDNFRYQIQKLRRGNDKQDFIDEFFIYAGYNLWENI